MPKLIIAVVCDSIDYTLGGSSISAKRFITALKASGNEIILITNSITKPKSKFFKGLKVYEIPDFPIFKSHNYIFGKISDKYLVEIFTKEKIDIVYSVYPTTFSGNASIKAAKRLNIPVVGHFHVQAENISVIFSKLNLDKIFYKLFINFYNKCDLVFCPSYFAQDLLIKSGLKVKSEVISNGVDLNRFYKVKPKNKMILSKYKVPITNFIFLYLGRLEKEKDIFTLIRASQSLIEKECNISIIIAGNGSQKHKISDFILKNKLEKNITLTGFIKNSDINSLYNCADCFVSPSLIELEGMTVLEAMACGLPIIVSDSLRSASKSFVSDNGFLFKSKDSNNLNKMLKKVIDLPKSDIYRLSKNSIKISKEYSFDNSVKKMQNCIGNLIVKN